MRRYAAAALAALLCLLVTPQMFAAHPTRPTRPAPRFVAASRRSASHSRRTVASARHSTTHRTRSSSRSRSSAATHRTSRRSTQATAHTRSRSTSSRSSAKADSDKDSFVSRSARAAAERRAHTADSQAAKDSDDGDEIRSRVSEIEKTDVLSLLPPPRTLSLYNSHGKLIVPAPLRGTHEILVHQNEMADREGLLRVQDKDDLADLRRAGKLVPLPSSESLRVDARLPEDRRYSRPWTATFLAATSRDFYSRFHEPLQVNSAVRTVTFQRRLGRTNGNAAPIAGDTASPHLTGQAVDIAKKGLSRAQVAWMRLYLQPLIEDGKIDVEEEFQQACFHISVYKSYMPVPKNHLTVASQQSPAGEP